MIKTKTISAKNFFENSYKNLVISKERKELLNKIAKEVSAEYHKNEVLNLNYICTHNSRRSQFGQVWSFFAAEYFNLKIHSFSGGTEVTAFFRNTVKTLKLEGFTFNLLDFSHQNPKYTISFEGTQKTILGFSKLFDNAVNQNPFIAITTCNNADENCPFIPTATHRFHLPFIDPKASDETDLQEETYEKTSQQIAGEIYFMFQRIKDNRN